VHRYKYTNTYFCSDLKNTMHKLVFILITCFLFTNCNDGDIITIEIDFEDSFSYCENSSELVFYKTKNDPFESLSIKLNDTIGSFIELDDENLLVNSLATFALTSSSNTFHYRTYNEMLPTPYFCEAVTPDITITNNSESTTGDVTVETFLTEDDDDGIPAELEDINENGNLEDDDTDEDGIPNYLDDDDDGDNVRTASENPNYSASTGLDDAQDTDEDGTPDYLDKDDDGDGVDTRDEENETEDQDPTNDITDNTIGPDYLNDQVSETVVATAFREHTIKQTFTITVEISDFSFPNLNQDYLDFGSLSPSPTTERTLIPDFN